MSSERLNAKLLNSLPGIVLAMNAKREVIFSNPEFDNLPRRGALGRARDQVLSACRQVLETGKPETFEIGEVGEPDSGKPAVWYQCSVAPVSEEEGTEAFVLAHVLEVTCMRGKSLADLENSLSSLQATLESTADGILVMDSDERIAGYNQRFLEIWDIPAGYLEAQGFQGTLQFVLDQLAHPDACLREIEEVRVHPESESFDVLKLKSGRVVERYSRPKRVADRIVGRVFSYRDITERVRAEQARKESEKRLFQFLETVPLGVFVVDSNGKPYFVNDRSRKYYGKEMGPDLTLAEHPDFFEIFVAGTKERYPSSRLPLARALRGERNVVTDDIEVVKDGQRATLQAWAEPIFNQSGKVEFAIAAFQDITALQRQREELESSLSLLNATLESTADGILVVDDEGKIEIFNKRFIELWGVPKDYLRSRDDVQALTFVLNKLSDPDGFRKRVHEIYDARDAESYELLALKDGRVFERYSRPQYIGGRSAGRVWSFRDITARVRVESRLKLLADVSTVLAAARLDLNAILDVTAKWISEAYHDGCIVRIFTEDRTRADALAFHHPDPETYAFLRQFAPYARAPIDSEATYEIVRTGKPIMVNGDTELLRSRIRPEFRPLLQRYPVHSWIIVPLRAAGQLHGLVSVFRFRAGASYTSDEKEFLQEIVDRAALAIDNAQLYIEAQRAIQLREDFMSIASHELKTPLTPLKMQLQLLRSFLRAGTVSVGPKGQELMTLIDRSDEQIDRLSRLVEDMLDTSRIATGRLTLRRERMDLSELVHDVVERFRQQLFGAKCDFRISAPNAVIGEWDRVRIEQVLANLLSNAIKYGAGKPIHIAARMEGNHAILSVHDQGIGIAQDDQPRIFQRFERAVSIQSFGGLGLGLYITHQIIEAHGGRIWFESELGKGTTFFVELPVRESAR